MLFKNIKSFSDESKMSKTLTNELWENILSRVGVVLNFGIEKKEQVKNSKMAKLIAAVPYLAGCNKAEETSFSNLFIYILSIDDSVKDIYFHKPEDNSNIYNRLFSISNFSGGDKEIIQCCMDLIALCMLSNYKKDAAEDKIIGKYNPLNSEDWEYDSISNILIKNIDKIITPEISDIYSKDIAIEGLWRD